MKSDNKSYTLTEKSALTSADKERLWGIWNNEYPAQLSHQNIEEFESYLGNLFDQKHILLMDQSGTIQGWYFSFVRDEERWFAMILDTGIQKQGWGRRLLYRAKEEETELNGWVIDHHRDRKSNGEIYHSPLEFYLKQDFKLLPEDRLELNKISAVKIRWKK
jgi:hypothetical protein